MKLLGKELYPLDLSGIALMLIGTLGYFFGVLIGFGMDTPSLSIERAILFMIFQLVWIGIGLIAFQRFLLRPEWLFEDYSPGVKKEWFSTKRVVNIAILSAAVLAFSFIVVPPLGFTLRPVPSVFAGFFFGPIEAFLSYVIGSYLSYFVKPDPDQNPVAVPIMVIANAALWVFSSWFYFRHVKDNPPKQRTYRYGLLFVCTMAIYYVLYTIQTYGYVGQEAFEFFLIFGLIGAMIVGIVTIGIAIAATESLLASGFLEEEEEAEEEEAV